MAMHDSSQRPITLISLSCNLIFNLSVLLISGKDPIKNMDRTMTKGDSMVEGLFVLMMYGCLGLCIHVLNAYTNCLAFV